LAEKLRYELRDDGVQYLFDSEAGKLSIRIRQKSAQRVAVTMQMGDTVTHPEAGDLDTEAFRRRLIQRGLETWGSVNGLEGYINAVSKDYPTRMQERQRAAEEHREQNVTPELKGTPYQIHGGGFARFKSVSGAEVLEPLTNFTARVEQQCIRDDGAEQRRWYRLTGRAGQESLPAAEVPATQFPSMNWVTEHWGLSARIEAGPLVKDHVRTAIETLSQGAPIRHLFQHTGWRKVEGRRVFLIGGGAVANPEIEVELEEGLTRYNLPPQVSTEEMKRGIDVGLEFLEVGPREITVPLLGATYLAPVAAEIDRDFVLWAHGPTGSLKSTLASVALSHYGDFTEKCLPLSFESTANALERSLFLAKDVLTVVDDFRPAVSRGDASEMDRKAQRLLRSVGNQQGRSRMQADTTMRASYPPRGVVIATGEALPEGPAFESAIGRSLTLQMNKADINLEKLGDVQASMDSLQAAMLGYIRWLSADWENIIKGARRDYERYSNWFRDWLGSGAHPRLPGICAALSVGMFLFESYAVFLGCWEDGVHEDFVGTAQWRIESSDAIHGAARRHMDTTKGGDPATRFLQILGALFEGNHVYVKAKNTDSFPEQVSEQQKLGWKEGYDGAEPVPGAQFVGWADKDFLYLTKDNTYAAVSSFAQRGGIGFGISPRALWSALALGGKTVAEKGRTDSVIKVANVSKRVVQIHRDSVFGEFATE
jgi:hypothetical protein